MSEIRIRTIVTLILAVISLLLIFIDYRSSILIAILCLVFAIANLRSAK